MKQLNRGFTLIELLVVIAIIGVLSGIILGAVNSSRNRSANAAIKNNLNNARAQAELYYYDQSPNTYAGVCLAGAGSAGIYKFRAAAVSAGAASTACNSNATDWALQAVLKEDEGSYHYWCVDSTGVSKGNTATQNLLTPVCP